MKEIKYKGFKIYSFDKKYEEAGKRIVDREYEEIEIYKNTERNYVARIEIDKDEYILKSPKSETIIPQRRIQTIFKKGEALTSLINIHKHMENGMQEFAQVYAVIVKKGIAIQESWLLMEYIEGEALATTEDIDKVMELTEKLHRNGIYHGDLNTSNFIKTETGMRILDTQGKQEKYSYFKRWNDIFILKKDLLVQGKGYDVEGRYYLKKRGVSYYMIAVMRKVKKSPIIEWIKGKKKELRQKGWKI